MKNNKNNKKFTVVKLILKGYTTEEIAKTTGYSIGHIRNVYTELRKSYNANSKTGVAIAFLAEKLKAVSKELEEITSIFK